MMEPAITQADDVKQVAEAVRTMTLCRCEIALGRARETGEPEVLTITEAMARLAPSRSKRARTNVVNVRVGWYIGTRMQSGHELPVNFVFKNPTRGGDVRWLVQQIPELETEILELYYVKDVDIPNGMEGEPSIQIGRPRKR